MAVTDTAVCAWGSNSCGQLGTRTFMDKASPTEIKELEGARVDHVACGAQHTLFLCRYAARCAALDPPLPPVPVSPHLSRLTSSRLHHQGKLHFAAQPTCLAKLHPTAPAQVAR